MTRRTVVMGAFVFLTGAIAGGGVVLACGNAPRMSAKVLLDRTTTDLRAAKTRVHVHLDTWEADSATGEHRHPGPTVLYVLEGEVEERTADGSRTLKTGDLVWHPADQPHNVKNRTMRLARALAVHLDPVR